LAKPSDLIPELQGRFPIRVELDSLTVDDFERILKTTDASLTQQYEALLATDGCACNSPMMAFIGWRKSRTRSTTRPKISALAGFTRCSKKLLEEVSFGAGSQVSGEAQKVIIDGEYVDAKLADLAHDEDLARYVL
jgi:ATP-dependent HslUV protease ATP-binding subunit HslU